MSTTLRKIMLAVCLLTALVTATWMAAAERPQAGSDKAAKTAAAAPGASSQPAAPRCRCSQRSSCGR